MEFRKAQQKDLKAIMSMVKDAQAYLKKQGINQWQNNYPNEAVIREDIEAGNNYVLTKEGRVVASLVAGFEGEINYEKIYAGQWLTEEDYVTLHRVVVSEDYKGQGMSSRLLKQIETLCLEKGVYSMRVDTHEHNLAMQSLLRKNHFKYCGVIYLKDQSKRIAFEKHLK